MFGSTTAWPSGLTVAASWDTNTMRAWGESMGKEFFDKGANVQLGPGVCVARIPKMVAILNIYQRRPLLRLRFGPTRSQSHSRSTSCCEYEALR